jgi:hypothetical protein
MSKLTSDESDETQSQADEEVEESPHVEQAVSCLCCCRCTQP